MTVVRDDWWDVTEFDNEIVAFGEPGHFEDVKSYLINGSERSILVDSGLGFGNLPALVSEFATAPVTLVITHSHKDHLGDNWQFDDLWVHQLEASRIRSGVTNEELSGFLADSAFTRPIPATLDQSSFSISGREPVGFYSGGEIIDLGNRQLQVLHVPGHTAGSLALFEESTGTLVSGDIMNEGSIKSQHPTGNIFDFQRTMKSLQDMHSSISVVYPAHYRYPLEPEWISAVHQSVEQIVDGRTPDRSENNLNHHEFNRFSMIVRDSWRTTG